ncbi:E3 UFM1-protein ligase 1-like protein [Hibiscus syriacus]|uniref:E3 UFM1-protein ligase 1-like protein n=1 Tax=Hibiscus syriacus TaxID=106335 RepID=A0A6A3A8T8_HIBSY|nr:E3 UFM1-protein ligase 1-like protein [Hibiscus syriacus]
MDDELLELLRQFEFAQQAKSSIRLSERNVVELVQKLHELRIIDFELLHTVSGKEYITPEQLRHEISGEVKKLGRLSLIDLADITGVDLYHIEKQAQHVVSEDRELMLIQGEIISQSYWDTVAEEINERLQECSQIALAELAAQLHVGSELVGSVLEPRLGTLVKGRLEGGQLYTPAYIARVSAMVRGASRGITVPTNLSVLWSTLQQLLQEMEGATGIHWTPTNSFISYDSMQKLGISQSIQYLQPRFPEGIPLVTAFVHPSMIEMLDSAIEDAIERGSWLDSVSLLPASFGAQDASKILSLCPSVQSAHKDVYDRVEKEMGSLIHAGSSTVVLGDDLHMVKEAKSEHDDQRKKGKSSGTKTLSTEGDSDNEDYIPTKSKKNQKKGKDATSSQVADSRKVAKKDSIKAQEENVPSQEWLMQKLAALLPDFEEQGVDDPQTILKYLADYLRPKLINYWKERRKALFTENVEKMKHLLDNVQRKLDESFLNMQLYEKALDLFEDDNQLLHLLRTIATSIADMLFHNLDIHNKLKNGTQVEDCQNSESISLSPGERTAIAKSLPENQSKMALAVVEALEGKDLTSQVSAETDPVSLLPKVVSLLYIQVHNRALQAPGRAISVTVTRLKDKLDDSAYKILTDFQSATVTLLALISAATGDEQDCSSDRITSKRELLECQMPALKALVLGSSQT